MKKTVLIGLACLIVLPAMDKALCGAAPKVSAFPGAEGFGALTPGGRYGQIVPVTTLDDYHPQRDEPIPGSLRWACTSNRSWLLKG